MQFVAEEGRLKVYANIPHPAFVEVLLVDFAKFDAETNETNKVELLEFFPVM